MDETLMLRDCGQRRRELQRIRWLDGTTDSMDMSLSKFWETGKDREACCSPCSCRVGHDFTTRKFLKKLKNWKLWGEQSITSEQMNKVGFHSNIRTVITILSLCCLCRHRNTFKMRMKMLNVNYIPPNKGRYLKQQTVVFFVFGSILCFFVFWSLHPLIDGKESCKDIDIILVENNMNLIVSINDIFSW